MLCCARAHHGEGGGCVGSAVPWRLPLLGRGRCCCPYWQEGAFGVRRFAGAGAEMTKAGLMEEMMNDSIEMALDNEDLEEESEEQVRGWEVEEAQDEIAASSRLPLWQEDRLQCWKGRAMGQSYLV